MRASILLGFVVLCAVATASPCAGVSGEFTAGVGGVWPQGEFASYGDPGPHALGRIEIDLPQFPAAAGWASVDYVRFSSETLSTDMTVGNIVIPVEQTTIQDAVVFHVGVQLGSSSKMAFFRPRVGVGVGVYYFSTNLSLEEEDALPEEEPFYSKTLDSHTCVGWRGIVGADFYFQSGWGVGVDILYDHVFNFVRIEGDEESDRTARFQGFAVGAVFPFGGRE